MGPLSVTGWPRTGKAMPGMSRCWGLPIAAFVRFPAEGTGTPLPTDPPSSRQVIVGGPYRYVRNPIYVAFAVATIGQALLLSRPVLLIYTAVLLIALAAFVHWYEEPTLARRFGAQYGAYRRQVPGWWPRLPRQTPPASPVAGTKSLRPKK